MTLQPPQQIFQCKDNHTPTKQITYDAGNGEQSTWLVCEPCSKKEPFTKFIVSVKEVVIA